MTKTNDITQEENTEVELDYDELVLRVTPIANPLASRKLTKKLVKVAKKAKKANMIRRGVIEVQKRLRKGETGFVIFAGDVTPIEVVCHLPGVCEEGGIPYCYVPSKRNLGLSLGTKRAVSCLLVKKHADYDEAYDECLEQIRSLPPPI